MTKQVGGNHYNEYDIEPWEAFRAWGTPDEFKGYLKFNVMKHLIRYKDKGGIQDIEKAIHYLEELKTILANEPETIQ